MGCIKNFFNATLRFRHTFGFYLALGVLMMFRFDRT